MDGSAEAIGSVNTIVNTGGQLRAYNTDYLADYQVPVDHAFAVLGKVSRALRQAGVSQAERDAFTQEETASDYDRLLQTVMRWVEVD